MVKRLFLLLLTFVMILTAGNSLADMKLWDNTPAQKMLKSYIENVNAFLLDNSEEQINKIFDQRDSVVELGVVLNPESDNSFMPEDVTVTVYMYYDCINYLLLKVNNAQRFPKIAAAFLQALNPKTMTREQAMKIPTERASKAIKSPQNSFEDVEFDKYADKETAIMNAEKPQTYYAYHPNQYNDGVNWIQLMIVFPMAEYWDLEEGVITKEEEEEEKPYIDNMQPEGYEGYFAEDYFEHYHEYTSPTPEPDSAAGEDSWY